MIRLETRANQGIKKGDLVKVIAGKEKKQHWQGIENYYFAKSGDYRTAEFG